MDSDQQHSFTTLVWLRSLYRHGNLLFTAAQLHRLLDKSKGAFKRAT